MLFHASMKRMTFWPLYHHKKRATRLSRHPVALSMNNLKLHCITSCSFLPFTIHLPSHWTVLLLFSLCCFVVFIVIDILCFVKRFLFIFLFNLNYLILLMSLRDISVWFFLNIEKSLFSPILCFSAAYSVWKKPFASKHRQKKLIDKEIKGCYKCFENR